MVACSKLVMGLPPTVACSEVVIALGGAALAYLSVGFRPFRFRLRWRLCWGLGRGLRRWRGSCG